jgi:hypothetical protein
LSGGHTDGDQMDYLNVMGYFTFLSREFESEERASHLDRRSLKNLIARNSLVSQQSDIISNALIIFNPLYTNIE